MEGGGREGGREGDIIIYQLLFAKPLLQLEGEGMSPQTRIIAYDNTWGGIHPTDFYIWGGGGYVYQRDIACPESRGGMRGEGRDIGI